MSLRVLIAEDVDELYEYFLRIFENLLPVEEVEFTRASSVQAAVEILPEPWDVILMDYSLGAPATLNEMNFRTGKDLVAFRRTLENSQGAAPRSFIVGISSNGVGNDLMVEEGADLGLLKLLVPEIAAVLKEQLGRKQEKNV